MSTQKPNILIITTHDSGRHFGCYGYPTVHTPAIDQLASEGVRLANHFCTSPICSASRASMMTGRYPQSHGLLDLCFPPFDYEMFDEVPHLSHILREAGYHTYLFGLQHETHFPEQRLDFQELRAQRDGGKHQSCDKVAQSVAQFLTEEADSRQPFYAQVGFFETHVPFGFGGAVPDDSRGVEVPPYLRDDDGARDSVAALQGALRQADGGVGIILEALERSGLKDQTLVIYTTDHGIEMPRAKWFLFDPGIEVAAIMRWPGGGIEGGRVCNWLTSHVDLTPTILDLANVKAPDGIEGISFAAGLREEQDLPESRDAIFGYFQKADNRCVRTKRYKLIRNFTSMSLSLLGGAGQRVPDVADLRAKSMRQKVLLFDLKKDPSEFDNVADNPEYAQVRADLEARLWQWMEKVNDPILQGPTRTPFYENSIADYRKWTADNV